MANTIKHKRGSGSNPSASDLVAGEIAIRTDTGVLFTKKDDNSVISISGGSTNLGVSTTSSAVTVTSSTGDNATISEATGSAAGVMSTAHHDKLDGIEANATADQTAAEIRTLVESASDSNVFTDADHTKLNGIATGATANSTESIQDIVGGMVTGNSESGISVTYQDSDGTLDFSVSSQTDNNFTTTLKNKLDGIESGATADQSASEILTALKTVDGAGSGLDADTLDGISSGSFLRSDAADTASGNITFSSTGHIKVPVGTTSQRPTAATGMIRFNTTRGCFEGYNGSNWVNMSPLNIDDVGAT